MVGVAAVAAGRRIRYTDRSTQPGDLDGELEREQVLRVQIEARERLDALEPLAQRVHVHHQRA